MSDYKISRSIHYEINTSYYVTETPTDPPKRYTFRQMHRPDKGFFAEGSVKNIFNLETPFRKGEEYVRGVYHDSKRTYPHLEEYRRLFFHSSYLMPLLAVFRKSRYYKSKTVIITRKMETDLSQLMEKKTLSKKEKLEILVSVAKAVQELHHAKWVHRDIKTENVLIKGKEVRLADPDFAAPVTEELILDCGTAALLDPNIWFLTAKERKDEYRGDKLYAADVYALGTLFVAVITGKELTALRDMPFKNPVEKLYYFREKEGPTQEDLEWAGMFPRPDDEESLDFLVWKMCAPNPDDRPPIDEVVEKLEGFLKNEKE